jgi:hypothetical protein
MPSTFAYEITTEGGKIERFEKEMTGGNFELPYRFSQRGAVRTRLLFKCDGPEVVLFSREVVLPDLLTVKPNAYRGILSTARRFSLVNLRIELAPDQEKLAGMELRLEVLDSDGRKVAEASRMLEGNNELVINEPVALAKSVPDGNYKVHAVLSKGGMKLIEAETGIKIIAPQPAQTIIDEDKTLLHGGKPFFPLGLYHVKPEDYEEVAKLGINTIQFWTWHGQRGLDSAEEHGLKVVFELNHKSEKIVRNTVEKFQSHPSVLMWYGLDEPSESSYGVARVMLNTYNEADDQHPVYMVSCRPDIFAEQSQYANVFAIDPYGSPQKVQDWTSKAVKAVDNRKPVICVPGVFGKETDAELRASAYIALANDARGIIWYPWSQAGGGPLGVGLKSNPQQQAVIKELCTEINALYPALTAPHRVPFQSADKKLLGIYCSESSTHYVVMVNSTPNKIESEVVICQDTAINGELRDFFQKNEDVLSIKESRFRIALEPYETRVFHGK